MSNLKQLGLAFRMYMGDYNQHVPTHNDDDGSADWRERTAVMLLHPYAGKSDEVLRCPMDTGWKKPLTPGTRWWSYCYNGFSDGTGPSNRGISYNGSTTSGKFEDPVHTVVFLDGDEADAGVEGNTDLPYQVPTANEYLRHSDGLNILFFDGHVSWMKSYAVIRRYFTLAAD